jgi:UDP-2-acetamido-3-amino-2,3-dideoxy-glucuronate N-acetyltransferase
MAVIHPTADVSPEASVGATTRVWHRAQIGAGARVGEQCIIGSAVYIDRGVQIGDRVKIQTGAQVYHGAAIEDGVFIGPLVCLTNDTYPRAIKPDGRLKTDADWVVGRTLVRYGASLGAGAVLLPDVTVGRFALVAAGAVVSEDVPDYGLVVGVPARLAGYVCACGRPLRREAGAFAAAAGAWECPACGADYVAVPGAGLCPATAPGAGGGGRAAWAPDPARGPLVATRG